MTTVYFYFDDTLCGHITTEPDLAASTALETLKIFNRADGVDPEVVWGQSRSGVGMRQGRYSAVFERGPEL